MQIVANCPIDYNPESRQIFARVRSRSGACLLQTVLGDLCDFQHHGGVGDFSMGAYVPLCLHLMIHRLIGLKNNKLNRQELHTIDIVHIWPVVRLFLFGE